MSDPIIVLLALVAGILVEIVGIVWSEHRPVYEHPVMKRDEHGHFIKGDEKQ